MPGTTDAKKAIHSFIPFFLLSFDKYLSEKLLEGLSVEARLEEISAVAAKQSPGFLL